MTIVMKDIKKLGYDVVPKDLTRVSEFPMPNFDEQENIVKSVTTLNEGIKEVTEAITQVLF